MLDSVWDDDEFSRTQLNRAISKLDPHPAAPDEKELIFSLVMMPRENALEFDHLHLLTIQLADDFRPPMLAESGEFFFQAHLFHEAIVAGVADPGYSERTRDPSRGSAPANGGAGGRWCWKVAASMSMAPARC